MPGTLLSYYVAFALQLGLLPGSAAAPAVPATKAPAARVATSPATKLVYELEQREAPSRQFDDARLGSPLLLGGGTAPAPAADKATLDASAIVDKVQKFYADIKQVTAKFRQEVTNATFARSTVTDGKVWIKKPGKMRWDYYAKAKKGAKAKVIKSFISNGSYLYVVDKQNKQVIEKSLEQNMLPVAVTFLYGKGDLKADFTARIDGSGKYGAKGDYVLELTPKVATTQYKVLYLVVDKDAFRVKESIIVDSANNVNHFRFYEPNFDAAVKDAYFVFDKKSVPDYRIVTDDDKKPAAGGE